MPVALPTERSKPTADLSQQTVLVYGPPKIGKSSFASRFPDALFFECEPGLNQLEVFKVSTYSWEDFLAACKLVASGEHRFKTVVVDTIDNAFKYCTDHVCGKHSIEYEGDMPHGKGWALVKNEWHRVLTRLASLPYGLVLISHAQDKTVETRSGRTVPWATGRRPRRRLRGRRSQSLTTALGLRPKPRQGLRPWTPASFPSAGGRGANLALTD